MTYETTNVLLSKINSALRQEEQPSIYKTTNQLLKEILEAVGGGGAGTELTPEQVQAIDFALNGGVPQNTRSLGDTSLNQLNSKPQAGFWFQDNAALATEARLYPEVGKGGYLIVLLGEIAVQIGKIAQIYITTDGRIYSRTSTSATAWSAWVRQINNTDTVISSLNTITQFAGKIPYYDSDARLSASRFRMIDDQGVFAFMQGERGQDYNNIVFGTTSSVISRRVTIGYDEGSSRTLGRAIFGTDSNLGFMFEANTDTSDGSFVLEQGERVYSPNNKPTSSDVSGLGAFATVNNPPSDGRPYSRQGSNWKYVQTFSFINSQLTEGVNFFKAADGSAIDDAKALRDAYFATASRLEPYDADPLLMIVLEYGAANDRKQAYQNRLGGNWVLTFNQERDVIDLSTKFVSDLSDGEELIAQAQSNTDDLDDIQEGVFRVSPKCLGHSSPVYASNPSTAVLGDTVFIGVEGGTGIVVMPAIITVESDELLLNQCYEGREITVINVSKTRTGNVRPGLAGQTFDIDGSGGFAATVNVNMGTGSTFKAMRKADGTFYWVAKCSFDLYGKFIGDVAATENVPQARLNGRWVPIEALQKTIVTPQSLETTNISMLKTSESVGVYYQDNPANATVANGYPFDGATGVLTVYQASDNTVCQKIIVDGSSDEYNRGIEGENFNSWLRLADEDDIQEVLDVIEEKKSLSQHRTKIVPLSSIGYKNYENNADAISQGWLPNNAAEGDAQENGVVFDEDIGEFVWQVMDTLSSRRSDQSFAFPTDQWLKARTYGDGKVTIEYDFKTFYVPTGSGTTPCNLWTTFSQATSQACEAAGVGFGLVRGAIRLQALLRTDNVTSIIRHYSSAGTTEYEIPNRYGVLRVELTRDNVVSIFFDGVLLATNLPLESYTSADYQDKIYIGSGSSSGRHQQQRFRRVSLIYSGASVEIKPQPNDFDKNTKFVIPSGNADVTVTMPDNAVTHQSCIDIVSNATGSMTVNCPSGSIYNGLTTKSYTMNPEGFYLGVSCTGESGRVFQGVAIGERAITQKVEVVLSGLSINLADGEQKNLIQEISGLTPTSGSFEPFINITNNKLIPRNESKIMAFKVMVIGSFATQGQPASLSLTMQNSNNIMFENRPSVNVADILNFVTFVSVDKDGDFATNGYDLMLTSFGQDFTITGLVFVIEQ